MSSLCPHLCAPPLPTLDTSLTRPHLASRHAERPSLALATPVTPPHPLPAVPITGTVPTASLIAYTQHDYSG